MSVIWLCGRIGLIGSIGLCLAVVFFEDTPVIERAMNAPCKQTTFRICLYITDMHAYHQCYVLLAYMHRIGIEGVSETK